MASQPIADPRPVVRCPSCRLNQFETVSKNCRRCQQSLYVAAEGALAAEVAVAEVITEPVADPEPVMIGGVFQFQIGRAIRIARKSAGLTQMQLAERMGAPRTWFTKLESGRIVPASGSLVRVAAAIGCSPRLLIELALA